jgi:predicted ATPase/DNA-binding XRE family transcriptional regulator
MRAGGGDSDATEPVTSFGDLLRTYRLRAGLSQEALAERAGISAKAIGAIEQGTRRAPYRHTTELLAPALGLSPFERKTLDLASDRARGRVLRRPASAIHPGASNLPRPLTMLIEREEIDEVAALLERHRLVTITGSGGVGKTRTAIEASSRRAAAGVPVTFVDLSSLRDGDLVVSEIASNLEARISQGDDALPSLVAALAARDVSLVLDNCEHVLADVTRAVTALLRGCPSVTVLATSRELLGLSNEVVYRLPSLQVPATRISTLEEAVSYSAVALFVGRAEHADAQLSLGIDDMSAVIGICRMLDGIPLAIELAAARVRNAGLENVLARFKDTLAVPGGRDLPPRQKTMEAAISWSYDLLNDAERRVFERISVFAGSFTLEAAEAVSSGAGVPPEDAGGLLMRLVDKSLVKITRVADQTRYTQSESIRSFGLDRLQKSAALITSARRRAKWFADLADMLEGSPVRAISTYFPDLDNARATIEWCLGTGKKDDLTLAARIAGGMRRVWTSQGRLFELDHYVAAILEKLEDIEENHTLIARLWRARVSSQATLSFSVLEQATPYFERVGDFEAIAMINAQVASAEARVGSFIRANDLLSRAASYFFEARDGRRKGRSYFLFATIAIWVFCAQGEIARARTEFASLRRNVRLNGTVPDMEADMLNIASEIEFASGNSALAFDLGTRALEMYKTNSLGSASELGARINLINYALDCGNLDEAERSGKLVLARIRSDRDTHPRADELIDALTIQHLAAVAAQRRQSHLAATLLGFIDATYRRAGITSVPEIDRRSYNTLVGSLSESLSDGELATLRAEGEALDFETAAELLLTS